MTSKEDKDRKPPPNKFKEDYLHNSRKRPSNEKTSLLIDFKEAMETKSLQTKYGFRAELMQIFLCTISNMALLSAGMTLGFTSVALPFMEKPNDVLNVTIDEASWIASLATIATPIGCLVSGPLLDGLGRKAGLQLVNAPALAGWLLIAARPSLGRLYLGRLLTGLATGLSSIPATVYMAESSTPEMRGFLLTGTSIAIAMGVTIVYTLGLIFQEDWQTVAWICAGCPVVASILTGLILPESPSWLVSRGRTEEARKSLMLLRATRNPDVIQTEFREMEEAARKARRGPSLPATLSLLGRPQSWKPLVLMNTFFFFQQTSGIFVVIFYAVTVVNEAGVTTDPFLVAVLIGLTRLAFTIVAAWMSKRLGRRPTALLSGVGMTLSLGILSTHLLLQSLKQGDQLPLEQAEVGLNGTEGSAGTDETPNPLPIIAILVYISASTIGFLTLPWSMIGEVFPAQIRGVASGFTTSMTYLFSFVTIKLFPFMMILMKTYGVFYFYGVMSFLGTIFVFFFLPETQGKTLLEIERHFAGKSKKGPKDEEILNGTPMVKIVKAEKINSID